MKLGISMWSYFRAWRDEGMTIPQFIQTAKQTGADGVELLDFFWRDQSAEMPLVMDALQQTAIPVGVYSVANNFVNPDAQHRAEQLSRITQGVDMAGHFGTRVVRVFAGNPIEGVTLDHAFNWIVEGLSEAAAYAQARGVTLALENHGLLAGKSDQVLRILAAVDNPAMRANPDTGNFLLVHQASHEAVRAVASSSAMVHLKDFKEVGPDFTGFAYDSYDGLRYQGVALGEGDVALQDCIDGLRESGFNGWVNIEYEGDEPAATALPRSVAYARRIMVDDPSVDPKTVATQIISPLYPLI